MGRRAGKASLGECGGGVGRGRRNNVRPWLRRCGAGRGDGRGRAWRGDQSGFEFRAFGLRGRGLTILSPPGRNDLLKTKMLAWYKRQKRAKFSPLAMSC